MVAKLVNVNFKFFYSGECPAIGLDLTWRQNNDFLIYLDQIGGIYYDVAKAKAKAMVLIGVLEDGTGNHISLAASDFWV
jgi:hypothetical protein